MIGRIIITVGSCLARLAGIARIKDIREGPGGAIYLATNNRGVLRFSSVD